MEAGSAPRSPKVIPGEGPASVRRGSHVSPMTLPLIIPILSGVPRGMSPSLHYRKRSPGSPPKQLAYYTVTTPSLHRYYGLECGCGMPTGWLPSGFRLWSATWPRRLQYDRTLAAYACDCGGHEQRVKRSRSASRACAWGERAFGLLRRHARSAPLWSPTSASGPAGLRC